MDLRSQDNTPSEGQGSLAKRLLIRGRRLCPPPSPNPVLGSTGDSICRDIGDVILRAVESRDLRRSIINVVRAADVLSAAHAQRASVTKTMKVFEPPPEHWAVATQWRDAGTAPVMEIAAATNSPKEGTVGKLHLSFATVCRFMVRRHIIGQQRVRSTDDAKKSNECSLAPYGPWRLFFKSICCSLPQAIRYFVTFLGTSISWRNVQ